jgi:hypothetical protein
VEEFSPIEQIECRQALFRVPAVMDRKGAGGVFDRVVYRKARGLGKRIKTHQNIISSQSQVAL